MTDRTEHRRHARAGRAARLRPLLALTGLLALTACAGGPGGVDWAESGVVLSGEAPGAASHTLARDIDPAFALATLSLDAGTVLSVSQRETEDGLVQTVVLDTPRATLGENTLTLDTRRAAPGGVSERAVRAELSEAFPGREAELSRTSGQNAYGPFAWARIEGECFYAWQRVTGRERAATPLLSRRRSMDIRLRHCRPNATAAGVEAIMRSLRLRSDVESAERAPSAPAPAVAPANVGAPARLDAPASVSVRAQKPRIVPKRAASNTVPRPAAKPLASRPAVTSFPMPPA